MTLLRRWRPAVGALSALTAVALIQGTATAGTTPLSGAAAREQAHRGAVATRTSVTPNDDDGGGEGPHGAETDLADNLAAYAAERSLPASSVSGSALVAAANATAALPAAGPNWNEVTNQPLNAGPKGYADPIWSNAGSGEGIVSGRMTALTVGKDGTWFAGSAGGGVWKSSDQGAHWVPTSDFLPSLSIGAVSINPKDGSLWVGTGEANTNSDAYLGAGVYRSTNNGGSYSLVGGSALYSKQVYRISFTSAGTALAATSQGLWRLDTKAGSTWQQVLAPAGAHVWPPYANQTTDVAIQPGTGLITAVIGWRSATSTGNYNGFYVSRDDGRTFSKVTPAGAIDASDIGRTTFAYAADGSKLYAVIESPKALASGAASVLLGVFRSDSGTAAGPWVQIADEKKLENSGSALPLPGYGVGVQAWYNNTIAVDPNDPNHVYVGLEEIFESTNAGNSWVTAAAYWNFGLPCGDSCPRSTHPDQHAIMVTDGKVVIGNDGGVYYRSAGDHRKWGGWVDVSGTLRTTQYYDADAGASSSPTGVSYWGGLQDNGTAYTRPGSQSVQAGGGDGFYTIVDPKNALRMVGEYTDMSMYASTNGGQSFTTVSPSCVGQETVGYKPRPDCDPNPRFSAPITSDVRNVNTWVAGGQYVWVSTAGWNTRCDPSTCSWAKVYDTGDGNQVTALSMAGGVIYAGVVGGGGNPGPAFSSGIATNYGGTWHTVTTPNLPRRYVAGVTVDPANPAHAFAIYNGFSRKWIPGGGVGHVFETFNGGKTWTDIDGNLPDTPGDALVIVGSKLVLATDTGAFVATAGQGANTTWSRAGGNLPHVSINNLSIQPDGKTVVAATHGRGLWSWTVS